MMMNCRVCVSALAYRISFPPPPPGHGIVPAFCVAKKSLLCTRTVCERVSPNVKLGRKLNSFHGVHPATSLPGWWLSMKPNAVCYPVAFSTYSIPAPSVIGCGLRNPKLGLISLCWASLWPSDEINIHFISHLTPFSWKPQISCYFGTPGKEQN